MKTLGYLLIAGGFLAGAYAASLETSTVPWVWFVPGLAAGVLGVGLVRLGLRGEARAADTVEANVQAVADSLRRLEASARKLDAEKVSIHPYEIRHRIDELFADDLATFVDARESIGHRHGLQAYADVMSHFATAERYLNRAWSASADGYVDEIHEYLGKTEEQFAEALAILDRVAAAPTASRPPR